MLRSFTPVEPQRREERLITIPREQEVGGGEGRSGEPLSSFGMLKVDAILLFTSLFGDFERETSRKRRTAVGGRGTLCETRLLYNFGASPPPSSPFCRKLTEYHFCKMAIARVHH